MAKKKTLKERLKETHAAVEEQKTTTSSSSTSSADGMLFQKDNYIMMGIGLLLILIGFALMGGGKSTDPNVFAAEELYSFRRITLAPILVLLGFAVEGYAILKKPAKKA